MIPTFPLQDRGGIFHYNLSKFYGKTKKHPRYIKDSV
jgi:hypothetical protein